MSSTILPPIDGNFLSKKKAKSTDRHKREKMYEIAKNQQLSVTTMRRAIYVIEYGSEEVKDLLREGKVSIWRAYNYVKHQKEVEFVNWLLKEKDTKIGEAGQ